MGIPAYVSSGALANVNNSSISVTYPATVNANDIAVGFTFQDSNNTPTGWTDFTHLISSTGNSWSAGVYWKRCTGSEDSTSRTASWSGSAQTWGVIHIFSGAITVGTPLEAAAGAYASSISPLTIASLTTLGADRLILHLAAINQNKAGGDDATNYSENSDLQDFSPATRALLYSVGRAAAGTQSADSYSLSGVLSGDQRKIGCALIGISAGYGNDVNGVASANIGKVIGVAKGNISKVIGS